MNERLADVLRDLIAAEDAYTEALSKGTAGMAHHAAIGFALGTARAVLARHDATFKPTVRHTLDFQTRKVTTERL